MEELFENKEQETVGTAPVYSELPEDDLPIGESPEAEVVDDLPPDDLSEDEPEEREDEQNAEEQDGDEEGESDEESDESSEETAKPEAKLDKKAKCSVNMQDTIKAYLDKFAAENPEFAERYANPKKSIQECCDYIYTQVKLSGFGGFDDPEIYGLAVHYYDEDDLGKIEKLSPLVVVNHTIELTPEEKEAARQKALERFEAEELEKIRKAEKVKAEREKQKLEEARKKAEEVPSLFDML